MYDALDSCRADGAVQPGWYVCQSRGAVVYLKLTRDPTQRGRPPDNPWPPRDRPSWLAHRRQTGRQADRQTRSVRRRTGLADGIRRLETLAREASISPASRLAADDPSWVHLPWPELQPLACPCTGGVKTATRTAEAGLTSLLGSQSSGRLGSHARVCWRDLALASRSVEVLGNSVPAAIGARCRPPGQPRAFGP